MNVSVRRAVTVAPQPEKGVVAPNPQTGAVDPSTGILVETIKTGNPGGPTLEPVSYDNKHPDPEKE